MSFRWTVWSAWTDVFPELVRGHLDGPAGYVVLGLGGLIAVVIVLWLGGTLWRLVAGGGGNSDANTLKEKLSDCPQPPDKPVRRLTVEGMPVRVRLVVVAPAGKEHLIKENDIEELLDGVLLGLRDILAEDRPRIRIWPPQLSRQGFAPTFHRATEKPEAEGRPSRWILVAGAASAGRKPILVGLGLWADTPNTLGRLSLDAGRWGEVLRVQTQGS